MAFEYDCVSFCVCQKQTCVLQSIPCGMEQVTVFAGYVKKNLVPRTFTMKVKPKNADLLNNRLVSSFSIGLAAFKFLLACHNCMLV